MGTQASVREADIEEIGHLFHPSVAVCKVRYGFHCKDYGM